MDETMRMVTRNGKVYLLGIDMGGGGTVIKENQKCVAVKWPGSKGWAGIGTQKYYPGWIAVYTKISKSGDNLEVSLLIDWTTARKK